MPSQRRLEPVTMDFTKDWGGELLSQRMIPHLFPSCVVRVCVDNNENGGWEAIYFEITKIKDGTFWGNARGTYRLFDVVGMKDGQQMTFRREHINEIPLDWQPRRYRKAVKGLMQRIPEGIYDPEWLDDTS